jgi:hypothetical protein
MKTKENWIEDFITLKILKIKDDEYWVGQITESEEFKCVIDQALSEEELKSRMVHTLRIILKFHQEENARLRKLAIFNGNAGRSQAWFTIMGIGLTINWMKRLKGESFICITKPGGLRIGKLLIFFQNHWKKHKK